MALDTVNEFNRQFCLALDDLLILSEEQLKVFQRVRSHEEELYRIRKLEVEKLNPDRELIQVMDSLISILIEETLSLIKFAYSSKWHMIKDGPKYSRRGRKKTNMTKMLEGIVAKEGHHLKPKEAAKFVDPRSSGAKRIHLNKEVRTALSNLRKRKPIAPR